MDNILQVFNDLTKSELIKAYRHKLKGEGKLKHGGIKRPLMSGQLIPWNAFRKLKKEIVMVHVFTEGCDAEYLKELTDNGFFNKSTPLHETEGNIFVYYPKSRYSNKGYHWCNLECCRDFSSGGYITWDSKLQAQRDRFINNIAQTRNKGEEE